MDLAGGAHARRDQATEQAGGDGQPRSLGNVVDLADNLDAVPRHAGQRCQQLFQRFGGAFHARRDNARSDYGRLQQPQVIAREIEDLGHGRDFDAGLQIDAHEAQHRPVDHAKVGFHRWPGRIRPGAAHGEIDGDVQHARAFRKIHPQKEDVAPAAMRQVHAHRRGFAEDGEERVRGPPRKHLRPDAQRVIGGVAGAEHPLVTLHGAHAAAHLVGQRLESQRAVTGGQSARYRRVWPRRGLSGQEHVESLVEAAFQQAGVARVGNRRACAGPLQPRDVETVDGVQEKQRPYAFVEIVARPAEAIERFALGHQLPQSGRAAEGIERAVAGGGIAGEDDGGQLAHCAPPGASTASRMASSSTNWASTSARSRPSSARASCAVSRP